MSEFKFNEQKPTFNQSGSKNSYFVSLILKSGLVDSKQKAVYVLLGIIVVGFVLTFYFVSTMLSDGDVPDRYIYDEEEYDPNQDPEEPNR